MKPAEVLSFIDSLRARSVQHIRMKTEEGFELELDVPPLGVGEIPESPDARKTLLESPFVSEELKRKIAEEMERDTFGAA